MRRVGIIGLGDMGMGMARNIINGGFPLTGFDLREARWPSWNRPAEHAPPPAGRLVSPATRSL